MRLFPVFALKYATADYRFGAVSSLFTPGVNELPVPVVCGLEFMVFPVWCFVLLAVCFRFA